MPSAPANTSVPIRQRRDKTPLWRLSCWGAGAMSAIFVLTLVAGSESGAQRLHVAINTVIEPTPPVVAVAQIPPTPPQATASPQNTAEVQKLTENLRLLAADRDRLGARLAALEHTLEDVTGSVKRQAAELASREKAQATLPAAKQPPAAAAPALEASAPPAPPPAISAPATQAPAQANIPAAAAIPDPVPLPPERIASLPPPAPESEQAPPKPEIGVDIGGASTPEALRAHWAAMKSSFGPYVGELHVMMTMRQRKSGVPDYRLILGPLPNGTAAGQLCARLIAARANCRPTTFNAQSAALL